MTWLTFPRVTLDKSEGFIHEAYGLGHPPNTHEHRPPFTFSLEIQHLKRVHVHSTFSPEIFGEGAQNRTPSF